MLNDISWLKRVKILNIIGDLINPATDEKLDELKTLLQQIEDNTDGLELKADTINLNTDELETKVQSVRNQLDVLLSTRASELTLSSVKTVLDNIKTAFDSLNSEDFATETTLSSIKTLITSIESNIDTTLSSIASEDTLSDVKTNLDDVKTKLDSLELIISTESTSQAILNALGEESGNNILSELKQIQNKLDVDLSTLATEDTLIQVRDYLDTVETELQEIKDTLGQESGTTVLSRLKDLWDKLVELFNDGVAKIKIWDGTNQANVTTDNKLKVETYQASGDINTVTIKDGEGNAYLAKVDASGRLLVSSQTVSPPDTTPVTNTYYSSMAGTIDSFYIIPNGETLIITKFSASGEVDVTAGNAVELYYAPNGNTTGIQIIDVIFTSGNADQHDLNESYIGNGTRAILIRRRRLSGGSKNIFGRWEGYF